MCRWRLRDFLLDGLVLAFSVVLAGCGTTKSRSATEQLLISDAVDRAIAIIDFSPLADKTVFLDTKLARRNHLPLRVPPRWNLGKGNACRNAV